METKTRTGSSSIAVALIADLRARGLVIEAVGDRLKVTPPGVLTAVDRTSLRDHKAELLMLLGASDAPDRLLDERGQFRYTCPPTGACGHCGSYQWRLWSTPKSGGAWLFACAACADRLGVHAPGAGAAGVAADRPATPAHLLLTAAAEA